MSSGHVTYASHQEVHVLRFVGEIRCPIAPAVSRFFASLMSTQHPRRLLVDLTETTLIDSTNLGQLARFANAMKASGGERITLLSSREDITVVLKSMGFDWVFTLIEHADAPPAGAPMTIEAGQPSHDELAAAVLSAHRALMAMNQQNHDTFKDMVELLAKEAPGEGAPAD